MKARVGDLEMYYRWDGPADGPIVMMAHAMGTDQALWDLQVPALSDRYRVLRYDWRGHGGTSAPVGPYSLRMFVDDSMGLLDVLDIERVHFVGISTGGMIAQGVGIHYPERVNSLILCNTMSRSNPWYRDWVKERHAVLDASGMGGVWDMTERLWFTDAYVDTEGPAYQPVKDVFVRTDPTGYRAATAAVAELDYLEQLPSITAPTFIFAAGADTVTTVDHARQTQAGIGGAQLFVIDGQRHFSNAEVPEVFNPPLRQFLDETSAG